MEKMEVNNSLMCIPSENRSDAEKPFLEFMGISLYFDDILILCLLFFLYQEGVEDMFLYVVLFLLLMS